MKKFIDVTLKDSYSKVLLPIDMVTGILSDEDGVFIEMGCDRKGESLGFCIVESIDEIKKQINQSEV